MGVEHPKPSLILQLLIQEWAALTISIAKCYGIFLKKFLLVNMSLLFFFRWIRVKYVIERIFQSTVLGPSKGRHMKADFIVRTDRSPNKVSFFHPSTKMHCPHGHTHHE